MIYRNISALAIVLILASCGNSERDYTAHNDDTGSEYAPQMYVSTPYEAYSQVESNEYNEHGMNMRRPAEGTVARTMGVDPSIGVDLLGSYPFPKDSLAIAAAILTNPIMKTDKSIADGEYMYNMYCEHCHGAKGNGDGLVAEKYMGVANINSRAFKGINSGHIYHVITMGKGRMQGHASQIRPADRWKIVHFVNQLRGYDDRKDPVRVLSDYEITQRTEIIENSESGNATILFPFGASATLVNAKLAEYLKGVAEKLSTGQLTIEGHTDNVDTREVNLPLGLVRADYIKNILVGMGVDPTQITTESKAFDEPVGDNNTVDGRRRNRRAELIFN